MIIGGGQAGLATAYHLTRLHVPCVVLDENDQVGAAWRKRWDSLRLFTPGRYDSLPGMRFPGPQRSYPSKDDIADYLQDYTSRHGLPAKTGVRVVKVSTDGEDYTIETEKGHYVAQNVVVATGAFHHPRVPVFAADLAEEIVQFHSSQYQRPSQVREGPVLIVGAGQSGAEIALDLAVDHHVWLSGRDPGEEPVVRGTFMGRLLTPVVAFAATRLINVGNPLGRKMRRHFFYPPRGIPRSGGTRKLLGRAGVECVERTTGVRDGYPELSGGRVLNVPTVIWSTGFVRDYGWIDLPIFDEYGMPDHERGVVRSHPGLYFIGLPFQHTLSSPLIMGVGRDAAFIARHIASEQAIERGRYKTRMAMPQG